MRSGEDEISKHEEVTGAILNEATEKVIVAAMAPPELATHVKLNVDRYTTYAQMKLLVVSYVNLKMPSQPMDTCIDHVDWREEYEKAAQG